MLARVFGSSLSKRVPLCALTIPVRQPVPDSPVYPNDVSLDLQDDTRNNCLPSHMMRASSGSSKLGVGHQSSFVAFIPGFGPTLDLRSNLGSNLGSSKMGDAMVPTARTARLRAERKGDMIFDATGCK